MKQLSSALVLLFSIQIISAQQKKPAPAPPPFVTSVEGVKEYRLANGLQVLLVPDPAISNVIVNVVYHVGSRNEGYGESGMAHLLEHMMFKNSKKFSSIKQMIADKGASANGTTWYDRTDYFEILPAKDSNLTWALDMESDRMVNSLMKAEDLHKEFSVVRNEFELGENYPDNILRERILSSMYLWHNYGKSTIGSKEDIERVRIGSLKAFYQKYYQPDNATLIVGGKFDETKTLQWISKYFEPIPKPTRVIEPSYTVEPPQDGERYVELRRNGDISYIGMAFHTPAFSGPEYAANDAVINILTNDPSGIFYRALVETKLATSVWGWSPSLYDPGFSYFACSVPKGKSLDSAEQAFREQADKLQSTTITQEDLERAKNALSKRIFDLQSNTVSFCINLAETIGAGDWRLFYLYRDRVEKLTLDEVQAALHKYYLPSNRTWGVFIPDKSAETKRVTVAERPNVESVLKGYTGKATVAKAETFEVSIPNIKDHTEYGTLTNGMKYALLKKPVKGDKIYANLVFKVGDENSLTGKNVIPELTARMLKNGTTSKSKKEINDELDKIKTSIYISGNGPEIDVSISSDSSNLNAALALLADMMLHPSFDTAEFDKMVLDMKAELEASASDPQYLAFQAVEKKTRLYPKGHPFYPESIDERLNDLQTASVENLKDFYKAFYGSNHGYASFVGNIKSPDIKEFLQKNFSNFNGKQSYTEIPEKYFAVDGSLENINVPDKKNAMLFARLNVPLKETDPDFVALEMANEMLGGGAFLSSRLPQRLRESEGMSYGAGSFVSSTYKYPSASWGMYAIFNPVYKSRLDSAMRDVVNKALKDGFKDDEFKKAVSSWLEQRQTWLGDDQSLAWRLSNYMSDGKDLTFYSDYENKAKALTLDQVNSALRKYISLNKITLVYAGDFKEPQRNETQKKSF